MNALTDLSPTQQRAVNHILIVDDIADNSFLLQTVLEAEGYSTEVAANGLEALHKLQAHPPGLVLLDVMMPGMNGFEVSRWIRTNQDLPYIPILLITGYDQTGTYADLGVGVDGFIRKPIDFAVLLEQVRTILQR